MVTMWSTTPVHMAWGKSQRWDEGTTFPNQGGGSSSISSPALPYTGKLLYPTTGNYCTPQQAGLPPTFILRLPGGCEEPCGLAFLKSGWSVKQWIVWGLAPLHLNPL